MLSRTSGRNAYGRIVGTTAIVPLTLHAGAHTFTLTVTDPGGLSSSATTQVTIQDTTAPLLSVSLSPNSLQPPNHKLIPITATVSASDACSAKVTVRLDSIVSNEPDNGTGDGDQPNDIQATDGGPVPSAATFASSSCERNAPAAGDGRIYTVTYSAADASGNSTSAVAYVVVGTDVTNPAVKSQRDAPIAAITTKITIRTKTTRTTKTGTTTKTMTKIAKATTNPVYI